MTTLGTPTSNSKCEMEKLNGLGQSSSALCMFTQRRCHTNKENYSQHISLLVCKPGFALLSLRKNWERYKIPERYMSMRSNTWPSWGMTKDCSFRSQNLRNAPRRSVIILSSLKCFYLPGFLFRSNALVPYINMHWITYQRRKPRSSFKCSFRLRNNMETATTSKKSFSAKGVSSTKRYIH